jgi:hypothetical protein
MSSRTELAALKNLLSQADRILETSPPLPENRTGACRELLKTALALTDDLIKHSTTPAALMGSKGGSTTAKRHGSEHYRQMAARRGQTAQGIRIRLAAFFPLQVIHVLVVSSTHFLPNLDKFPALFAQRI